MWRTDFETANVLESSRDGKILKGHLHNRNQISNHDNYMYRTYIVVERHSATVTYVLRFVDLTHGDNRNFIDNVLKGLCRSSSETETNLAYIHVQLEVQTEV